MADKKQPPHKKLKTSDNEETLFDKFCDPDHPKTIQFEDVSAAAVKTKDAILRTPCAVRICFSLYETKPAATLKEIISQTD